MRHILLILTLAGLTAAAGCRMCAHPYDECGPTYVGECGPVCCNPYARAGSVLSPPLVPMAAAPAMIVEGAISADGDATIEPIPAGPEVSDSPEAETSRVVPLPPPPGGAQAGGPTFLR